MSKSLSEKVISIFEKEKDFDKKVEAISDLKKFLAGEIEVRQAELSEQLTKFETVKSELK
jgi:hypothetical protein